MTCSAFVIGDRVAYSGTDADNSLLIDHVGTVIDVHLEEGAIPWIGVDWDDFTSGWDCNGLARNNHGFYVYENELLFEDGDRELVPTSIHELFETL